MKINWKEVAQTEGYISLKKQYARAVHDAGSRRNPMRDKAELLKHFNWIIGRAEHYAHKQGKGIEVILAEWESHRTYCWLNYYQECRQPKLATGKPRNVKPRLQVNYLKKQGPFALGTKRDVFERIRLYKKQAAQFDRKHVLKKKARWPAERKARQAKNREIEKRL